MRGLLFFLCCLVALTTCRGVRYDLSLNHRKTYEYKYAAEVNFGLGKPNRAESAVRMMCNVKISGESPQTFILQVSDVTFAELNGIPGKSDFNPSPKLSQRIAAQLAKPIKFEHSNGHVGNIHAARDISDTAVNIVRGILSFFHVTVKTSPTVYELEEAGIHGVCQSNYATEINRETHNMNITQVVDISNCRDKAAIQKGMATAVQDKDSKQRGESLISTVRYLYTIQPTEEGGIVKSAYGLERQYFSPFNVKRGSFRMKAKKEMVLTRLSEGSRAASAGPMENRGNLVYKFVNSDANIPLVMQDMADPKPKALRMIKQLAENHRNQINNATTEDTLKVYELLRVLQERDLDEMWVELARNDEHRRFFLDMVAELNDERVLKFLEKRFQAKDVSTNEALQTLLIAVDHLQATPEVVEKAKILLTMELIKSSPYLWPTAVLSYGSLVYKYCAYHTPCPQSAVQPLLDIANEGLRNHNETEMVIALKALGNAGHPSSIKTITRFLPGVAANAENVSPRVQSAAVQAMRLTARRDPHNVQDTALKVFLQKNYAPETRMLAIMVLFDTKPSMALVSTLAAHLEEEKDLHLASFAYSYLKNLATSKTPDNHDLSTSCSLAVKILAAKFGHLCPKYSRSWRMDLFDDDFLMGISNEIIMLRGPASVLPTKIMTKRQYYAIGRVLQLMEYGIRADGLKQIFGNSIPGFKGDLSYSDLQAIYNVLKNWESLPNNKPVLSAYSRASGQEFVFAQLKKDLLEYIKRIVSPSASRGTPVWDAIETLKKGLSWHWTKPFLTFEARYTQATTLGFPMEISKYYQTVTGITVNAKAAINPAQTQRLGDLVNADISLDTDGVVGFTKDFWIFCGINTELFQCGSELKSKAPVELPWKLSAKINIGKKKFELDVPACKKEIELFSIKSNVYAISRNIGHPESPKRTPMIPDDLSQERPTPNNFHRRANVCAKNSIYGVGVCVDYEVKRQYFQEEYPLYYLLGYTHMAVKVVPAEATRPVEKIHFEINANPISQPGGFRELFEIFKNETRGQSNSASNERGSSEITMGAATPKPAINIKALAMSGDQRPEGFDVILCSPSEGDTQRAQVIVSHVGAAANWKLCIDATAESRSNAKAKISWGAQCKPYEVTVMAAAVQSSPAQSSASKPALQAKVQWTNVPENIQNYCSGIERYIPGMALLHGFNQTFVRNPRQEVCASIVASSSDSVDVIIKLPEYTVSRQAVPVPIAPDSFLEENAARTGQA
ncbi:vitellogenin 3, phosvitinless isoform X2 [Archocentrus centrarchus]|uniref:vitellogenin 3, phosvitinless isoform X2 n=1 Tax=Archocentrus centrarchus TaxID=63155 RepID=UPI0011EA4E66|nr:vitellogenin-like isoform X2 [Archocentrus centrarchus]